MKKAIPQNPGHKQLLLHVTEVNWDYEIQRIISWLKETGAMFALIDLFCGAGGTSTGAEQAEVKVEEIMQKIACVILGINHDKVAIQSHQVNHPRTLHLVEDVRETNLIPIAKLVQAIRRELPHVKIVLWASAECTNHSKAKGGDARDADSRSLPEELYRYITQLAPDLIQIENVIEFMIWGPLIQKNIYQHYDKKKKEYFFVRKEADFLRRKIKPKIEQVTGYKHRMRHPKFGALYSKNKQKWYDKKGNAYSRDKNKGIVPWMVPDKRYLCQYFNQWRDHIKSLGYPTYEDRKICSADVGACTTRTRYFGQFGSPGMPLLWPRPTHAKNPDITSLYGKLKPYRAVREVLDLQNKGESIFDPQRKKQITSDKTYDRVFQGGVKFVPNGKQNYEAYINGYLNNDSVSVEKANVQFLTKYHAGKEGKGDNRNHSLEEPARSVDTQNRFALTDVEMVLPFIVQYNNNCDAVSPDKPLPPVLTRDKFYLASNQFIQQAYAGGAKDHVMVADINNPARTITCTGGNQSIVDAEQILPFISMYYSNGHNCRPISEPAPTIPCADNAAVVSPEPFIMRYFTEGGGQHSSINNPAGGVTCVPKMHLVSPTELQWIMNTSYNNVGSTIDESMHTLLGENRHHPYLMSHHFNSGLNSVDEAAPTVIAQQGKKPLHLVQVVEGDASFFGIVIYKHDSESMRRLKRFMAANNIIDIKMRMLTVNELLQIQGFPKDYVLKGSQTDQKKFIGNSVEVTTAMKMIECYGEYLYGTAKQMAV